MAKKLPYISFFTSDYIRDTRILSLEARAVWMDMLCMMHDGDHRGYLSRAGSAVTTEQLARFCGCPVDVAERAVTEIVTAGVASRDESGVVYSRRIVRDDRRRRKAALYGKQGGNPTLKGRVNHTDNAPDNVPLEYGNGIGDGTGIGSGTGSAPGGGAGEGRRRFTPPTVADVAAYCRERGSSVDPETFVNHYVSNGWRVGKNPMRNWKAAVCTWEKNGISGAKPAVGKSSLLASEAWKAVIAVVQRHGERLWKPEVQAGWWSDRKREINAQQTAAMEADVAALPPLARQAAEQYTWRVLCETNRSIAFAQFSKVFDQLAARGSQP